MKWKESNRGSAAMRRALVLQFALSLTFSFVVGCASHERKQTTAPVAGSGSYIFVYGIVSAPGRYPWRKGMHLIEGIAAGGGFTEISGVRIRVSHTDGTAERFSSHQLRQIVGNRSDDPILRPGDVIFVD